MNNLPRQMLSRIIAKHGRGICDSPKRVEALLRDLCGMHRREINIIIGALEERVAADLIGAGNAVPREVLLARLAARLRDNLAYTPEAARWGIETWAVALEIVSEAELQTRARIASAEATQNTPPRPVPDPKSMPANPASVNPQTPRTKTGTTSAPPRQPTQPPKINVPPPLIVRTPSPSPPAPAPHRMPVVHPKVAAPVQPPDVSESLPLPHTSRRGRSLRGCLLSVVLIFLLIVAAIFVVPAIILLLQEEQAQPTINDPRIR
jgi:hypothetical protein